MKRLTAAEYGALTSPPEVVVSDANLFDSLLERELLIVVYVDPVTRRRHTNLSPLGVLAKRLYETGVMV